MSLRVEAVYENGVLRPLTPIDLPESERVTLLISQRPGRAVRDRELVERASAEVATMAHRPTIEEVRRALSKIPGSMVSDVIAEREDL
ncbi:MAG: antitoxin family protein [Acidobacteriia bacterium]|nr:antitoxin family protein [Terriglobia bacterium]